MSVATGAQGKRSRCPTLPSLRVLQTGRGPRAVDLPWPQRVASPCAGRITSVRCRIRLFKGGLLMLGRQTLIPVLFLLALPWTSVQAGGHYGGSHFHGGYYRPYHGGYYRPYYGSYFSFGLYIAPPPVVVTSQPVVVVPAPVVVTSPPPAPSPSVAPGPDPKPGPREVPPTP